MIYISRCPYRVSLLGGGSDLCWWNREVSYGLSLGFSINKYTHIALSPKVNGPLGILNYSSREIYESVDLINCHSYHTYQQVVKHHPGKTNFIPHALPEEIFFGLIQYH